MSFWNKIINSFSFNNEQEIIQQINLVNNNVNQLLAEELYHLAMMTSVNEGGTVIPNYNILVTNSGLIKAVELYTNLFALYSDNGAITITTKDYVETLQNQIWIFPSDIPELNQVLSVIDYNQLTNEIILGWKNTISADVTEHSENAIVIWSKDSNSVKSSKFKIENDILYFPGGVDLNKTFSLKGNPAQTTDLVTLTFPANVGETGQIFQNTGNGVLAWVDPPQNIGNVFGSGIANTLAYWSDETTISSTTIQITFSNQDIVNLSNINEFTAINSQITNLTTNNIIIDSGQANINTINTNILSIQDNTNQAKSVIIKTANITESYNLILPNTLPIVNDFPVINETGELEWRQLNKIVGPDITTLNAIVTWGSTNGSLLSNSAIKINGRGLQLPHDYTVKNPFYLTILSPPNMTTDYTFTYPPTPGLAGQVLTNIGNGNTIWAVPEAGIVSPGGSKINALVTWANDTGTAFANPAKVIKINQYGGLVFPAGNNGQFVLNLQASTEQITPNTIYLPPTPGLEGQVFTSLGNNKSEWRYPALAPEATQINHLAYWGSNTGESLLSSEIYIENENSLVVPNYIATNQLILRAGEDGKHKLTFQASFNQLSNTILTFPSVPGLTGDILSVAPNGQLTFESLEEGTVRSPAVVTPFSIAVWDNLSGTLLRGSSIIVDPVTTEITSPGGVHAFYFELYAASNPDANLSFRASFDQEEDFAITFPKETASRIGQVMYVERIDEIDNLSNSNAKIPNLILDWVDLVTGEDNPTNRSIPVWGNDVPGFLTNTTVVILPDDNGLVFHAGATSLDYSVTIQTDIKTDRPDSYTLVLPKEKPIIANLFLTVESIEPELETADAEYLLYLGWTDVPPTVPPKTY